MKNRSGSVTREVAQQKYHRARHNLLMVILFTAINLVLLATGSGTMFLFSASIPYLTVLLGMVSGFSILLTASIVIAAISMILYLLCWWLSKKHPGWIIAASVFFVLDTLLMLAFYIFAQDFSGILDILIHAWVLCSLILGAKNGIKLKHWPEEEYAAPEDTLSDSLPLRSAGYDAGALVLAEAEWQGNRICCRRTESVDELIVNGFVLAEAPVSPGMPLLLSAVKDGSTVTVLSDASHTIHITVNGTSIASWKAPF